MFKRTPVAPSIEVSSSGRLDRLFGGVHRAALAGTVTDAHMRNAAVLHDRTHVRKVQIDQAGNDDQIGNALDALIQNVVRHLERFDHRRALADDLKQFVVRDHNKSVDPRL